MKCQLQVLSASEAIVLFVFVGCLLVSNEAFGETVRDRYEEIIGTSSSMCGFRQPPIFSQIYDFLSSLEEWYGPQNAAVIHSTDKNELLTKVKNVLCPIHHENLRHYYQYAYIQPKKLKTGGEYSSSSMNVD